MKRICEKLKSRRGASMVFALLVFLLCVFAGTAALTAASSNIGRYTHLENDQRQYFSVASALDLIEEKLNGEDGRIEAKIILEDIERWEYDEVTGELNRIPTQKGLSAVVPSAADMSYFQNLLVNQYMPEEYRDAWSALNKYAPTLGSLDKEFTITFDPADNAELADLIYPVTVKVKSGVENGIFNLIMYFSTEGGAYPLKVEWPGVVETKTVTGTPVVTGTDNEGMRTTTTTITITLTWSGADRQITFEKAPS